MCFKMIHFNITQNLELVNLKCARVGESQVYNLYAQPIPGYTSYNWTCFVCYLKISNTLTIVQGTQEWHWHFSRPHGF